MSDSKFLQVPKQAALEAGNLVLSFANEEKKFKLKGRTNDFATQADLASDKLITGIIKSNFPEHNIIAEESGQVDKGSEYTWAIDPIDGTIAYTSGLPTYGISIGLLKDNQPYVGVIYLVGLKELYWAEKDKGAYMNDEQIQARQESQLAQSTIGLELGHTNRVTKLEQYYHPIVDKVRGVYSVGSAVWQLVSVANGRLDGIVLEANLWDFAAGAIIVTEAGGEISDFAGGEINWEDKRIKIIASNGLIHKELVSLYKDLQ